MEIKEILSRKKQIKTKLMAATSMLLVSSIMLSTTTYAWFTLSTAPEVTEMQTTAGANGALEIALQSTNEAGNGRADIKSGVGNSTANVDSTVANTYWGNIVDLNNGYGLEHITIYPSRLNVNSTTVDGNQSYAVDTNSILKAAKYGIDGRVVALEAAKKTHYNAKGENAGKFTDTANWGVNVIGFTNNGDTATDNSFVRAYSRANVLAEATQKVADYRTTLRSEMGDLIARNSKGIFGVMAFIVGVELLTQDQLMSTVTDYISSMDAMIGDAADAVRWALLANAVADDRFKSESEEDMKELGTIYKEFLQYPLSSEDAEIISIESLAEKYGYEEIALAAQTVSTAQARIALAGKEENPALAAFFLVKESEAFMYGMNANGSKIPNQGIRAGLGYDLAAGVTSDTIFMVETENADPMSINLFSSLATILGDYEGMMTIWLKDDLSTMTEQQPTTDLDSWIRCDYGIKATNKSDPLKWKDVSNLELVEDDSNIGVLGSVYQQVASKTATGDILMPITRTDITSYGYSIDLAFQASESTKLVLQKDGISRVSGENNDRLVQGAGSNMTFTIPGDLSHEQAKELLQCVYIVFMNTANGSVYKIAAPESTSIDTVLGTATATLQLYDPDFAEDGSLRLGTETTDNVLFNMTKDTPYYITAVVYLNGDVVDNSMLSSSQVLSLDGMINLQFSSSTSLQGMKYSNYMSKEETTD